ncbi:MAG: aromatic ring-hydroxylating dioxygenase subunit alpha [Candidatus Binataceae bacterium]|nr:aromatic ring-hydroxylating dioxygenase subunit alpha [Candidatus Binataceae bacterium]
MSNLAIRWPANQAELPKAAFHREDLFQREIERIFLGPEWHPVAHRAELPKPGDFKTFRLGTAPIIAIHGEDGKIRVFFNSCTHRGTQLQTQARGHAKEVECPYHRWLFNTCGDLLAAPGSESFPESFRKQDYNLRELRSSDYYGVIFVTASPAAPALEDYLGELKPLFAKVLGDSRLTLLGYQKVMFSSNWKEYNDNEGYHAPLLHRAFRLLKWQAGKGTQRATEYGHVGLDAELQSVPNSDFLNDPSLVQCRDGTAPKSVIIALFPLATVLKHIDVINIRLVIPHSVDETEVHYAYFAHQDDDSAMLRHRLRQSSNLLGPSGFVSLEDGAVFNRIHQGSMTPGNVRYQKGIGAPIAPPCIVGQNDESANPLRWEYYRKVMEIERERL